MNKEELSLELERVFENTKYLEPFVEKYSRIIILGSGANSAIASILAQDYTKKYSKNVITFSDPVKVVSYMETYGMANAYQQFLKEQANPDTLVILVSSADSSENLIRAAHHCGENFIPTIVLTSKSPKNTLSQFDFPTRLFHYQVQSESSVVVECVALVFFRAILD